MNGFTFSPALGWVAGGLLAAGLAVPETKEAVEKYICSSPCFQ